KRSLVIRQIGHIPSHCLCLSSKDIQQFVLHHKVKEFFCFRGKLFIHLLTCCQDFFRCSLRAWASLRAIYLLIGISHMRKPQPLLPSFIKAFCKWNKDLFHLTAEIFHFFPSVAVSLHSEIPQRRICLKPQFFRLERPV